MSPAIQVNDLSWLIGGPQGSGVDSSANVFARACAAGGLNGFGKTIGDLLAAAKQRGVALVPIPFKDLLDQIADEFQIDQLSKISRVVNMLAVGASFGLLGFDFAMMRASLEEVFRAKAKIVNMNAAGAQKAYDLARSLVPDFRYRLQTVARKEPRLFLTGSQATALGKLYGGMRFQTYYPITPASDESEFLEENEVLDLNGSGLHSESDASTPKEEAASILVVQTEDEIAAITMATGAALTGTRSATATSGPGFSLMMEGIGWASINEVPVVITLYQRAGPSTGMPTRHEQGDLRFALHAGHGESPRILLASGDFDECIRDGLLAFNYADRYQMPVIHLVDKALANSYATTPVPDLSDLRIDRGAVVNGNNGYTTENPYKRFDLGHGPVTALAFLGQPGTIFVH